LHQLAPQAGQLQRFVTRRRLLLVAEEMLRPKAKIKIKAINI
jgi:hypothetical protein